MLSRTSDFYFSGDDSHRYLPWLIGIMSALATLLLFLGVTLNGWIIATGGHYNRSFTVNIPASNSQDAVVQNVQTTLERNAAVASVGRISEEKLLKMLEPWLGNSEAGKNLPLPVVFDVALKSNDPKNAPDYVALEKDLLSIAKGIEIDAHQRWIAAFSDFSTTAQVVLSLLALILMAAMAMMIAYTSRASLKLHGKTLHLLHSIGAQDSYITRQFQHEAGRLVLLGAVSGSAAAGLMFLAMGQYAASLSEAAIPALDFSINHVKLLVAMPLGCAVLAWLVARFAVQHQLRQSL